VVRKTDVVTYSFRWPFAFPAGPRLPFRTDEWLVLADEEWQILVIPGGSESLYDSRRPVLLGQGFASEDSATKEAMRARSALERVFAAFTIGAYFDGRARGSIRFSQALLDAVEEETGHPLRPDNSGLTVYRTDPAPGFIGFQAEGRVDVPADLLDGALASPGAWADKSDEEHAAYAIFTAAGATQSSDAQFLMLVMAVEVLADVGPRSEAALAHVDQLVRVTKDADLTIDDKAPLLSALSNLRTESVGHACRRYLDEHLAERAYGGMSPGAFFGKCYGIRSGLTHGGKRAEPGELVEWLNPLQQLVGDLLGGAELAAWRDEEQRRRYGS